MVKPLPGDNKPAGYKGAVGRFSIDAKVEHNNFSTDDAGNMAIIISGEGNLQMINAPDIAWPAPTSASVPVYEAYHLAK